MRRIVILAIVFVILLPLGASALTYSFSQNGETIGEDSFGSLALGLGFSPFKEKGYLETEIISYFDFSASFRGFDLALSTPIILSSDEIFSYAFSNRVLWEPTLGVQVQYRRVGDNWLLGFFLSPLKFADTSFSYELLSPYFSFDLNGEHGWGIRVIKITAFLEV